MADTTMRSEGIMIGDTSVEIQKISNKLKYTTEEEYKLIIESPGLVRRGVDGFYLMLTSHEWEEFKKFIVQQ